MKNYVKHLENYKIGTLDETYNFHKCMLNYIDLITDHTNKPLKARHAENDNMSSLFVVRPPNLIIKYTYTYIKVRSVLSYKFDDVFGLYPFVYYPTVTVTILA